MGSVKGLGLVAGSAATGPRPLMGFDVGLGLSTGFDASLGPSMGFDAGSDFGFLLPESFRLSGGIVFSNQGWCLPV